MSDAALYHEELLDLEQQLRSLLADVNAQLSDSNSSKNNTVHATSARSAALTKAQDHLRRLNRLLQQLRVEVRLLDGGERTAYEKHATSHASTIATLKEETQKCRERVMQATAAAATQRHVDVSAGVTGGFQSANDGTGAVFSPQEGSDDGDDGVGPAISNRPEARQAAGRIQAVQQSTLQSLGQSEKLLNETETIGVEAATTLRAQTEQIKHTNEELTEMHGEIGRASVELKAFMRRMARDRVVIFFAIAIVVCIIVIVILAVVKRYLK